MIFKQIRCGGDRNFGYIIADENAGEAAVVDPSPDPGEVVRVLEAEQLKPLYIICTHDHYDHTGGNRKLKRAYGARTVFHRSSRKGDVQVDRGDTLTVGALTLQVLHTPGHTGDSISILAEDHLVTGDFLFVGKIGGTRSRNNAQVQFDALIEIMMLDDTISVWPGHDVGVRPSSTIGEEKRSNPFCQRLNDFEEFYHLKETWADYKREHGIV